MTDPRVIALTLDVTDAASIAAAGHAAPDVGILINNAGIARMNSALDADTSKLREQLETNLFGPLAQSSTFADRIADKDGAVVKVAFVLVTGAGRRVAS